MLTSFFSFSEFQPLPEVPRIWKPAVQCPDYSYPNDTGFRFCQACGYKRKSLTPVDNPHLVFLDLPSFDHRLETLQAFNDHKPYQVQKSKLRKEFESFLSSLPRPKTLLSASPRDVTRFLVWKDSKGKTKVHVPSCSLFGSKKAEVCPCTSIYPCSRDSCKSYWKLRSLFVESGRGGEWNDLLGIGNPAFITVLNSVLLYRCLNLKGRPPAQMYLMLHQHQLIPVHYSRTLDMWMLS